MFESALEDICLDCGIGSECYGYDEMGDKCPLYAEFKRLEALCEEVASSTKRMIERAKKLELEEAV